MRTRSKTTQALVKTVGVRWKKDLSVRRQHYEHVTTRDVHCVISAARPFVNYIIFVCGSSLKCWITCDTVNLWACNLLTKLIRRNWSFSCSHIKTSHGYLVFVRNQRRTNCCLATTVHHNIIHFGRKLFQYFYGIYSCHNQTLTQ